jgi:hypothetical protein
VERDAGNVRKAENEEPTNNKEHKAHWLVVGGPSRCAGWSFKRFKQYRNKFVL